LADPGFAGWRRCERFETIEGGEALGDVALAGDALGDVAFAGLALTGLVRAVFLVTRSSLRRLAADLHLRRERGDLCICEPQGRAGDAIQYIVTIY
jgi:hypothetical protein